MRKYGFLLTCMVLVLTGCTSAHISPLHGKAGSQVIYVTEDEPRVFSTVFDVLTQEVNDAPVEEINESIRGYKVRYKFGLDYKDFVAKIFPAIGKSGTGDVHGYYVEVSTDGSMMNGSTSANRVFRNINAQLATFAKAVTVSQITRGRYLEERDQFRLNSKGSLRDGGTIRIEGGSGGTSMADEIRKLNELKRQGLITQEEYEAGKRKILGS